MYTLYSSVSLGHPASCVQVSHQVTAVGSADSKVYLYTSGKLVRTLEGHTAGVSDVSFSPNGRYLASCADDQTIRLWDVKTGETIRVLKNHTYHVTSVKFNCKGSILVSGSSDENIRVWDVKRSKCLRTLSAHSDPICSVDLSFDGTIIASGSYDGLVRLFDLETGQCLKTLVDDQRGSTPVGYVRFSPNSKYILASYLDGDIRLWDYMNNRIVKTYNGLGGQPVAQKYSLSCGFTGANPSVVNSGDEHGHILFWDVQSKEIIEQLEGSDSGSPVMGLAFNEDDSKMVSVSLAGEVKFWAGASDLDGHHLL